MRTSLRAGVEAAFKDLPETYEALCNVYLPRKIHDKTECRRATAVIDVLSIREDLNEDQLDYLELIGDLVNDYEETSVPQPENAPPTDILRYLLEANKLSTRELSRVLGKDESIVSKILNGERSITIEHAKKLGFRFGLDPALFLDLRSSLR